MIRTHIPARPRNKKIVPTGGSSIAPIVSSGGSSHSHSNKSVIDKLTQGNIDVLSYLSLYQTGVEMEVLLDEFGDPVLDVNGDPVMVPVEVPVLDEFGEPVLDEFGDPVTEQMAIYAIKSTATFFSEKEVSAYGLGDEGSGSVDLSKLLSWAGYTSEMADYYAPASLLVPFYNDMQARVGAIENTDYAELDSSGKVLSSQLPSYVDDVIEATSLSAFPLTGESGKIYIAQDTNRTYRWSGTAYTEISASLALGETSSTAYRGDRGKTAYDHTFLSNNPHGVTASQVGSYTTAQTDTSITNAISAIEIGGRNLIIKNATTKGYYDILGVLRSANNTWISDFIEVSEGKEYTAKSFNSTNNVRGRLIYFDADKTFVTRGGLEQEETFVIPAGVGYIRYQSDKAGGVYVDDAIIVKGNKATDWTPAPEDQVSDWNITDATSFSFIKNKPTQLSQFTDNIGVATHIANKANPHAVTTSQIGAVDLTTNQTIGGVKTFTGNVTAPTFIGALTGNASTATTLKTARTIWGQLFNGSANVTGALTGATTISASTSVTTPKVIFAAAGWSLEQTGTELQMKYNGAAKMRFLSGGSIVATQEITAYS